MTLENLLAIKRLQRHEAGRAAILKLLAAAGRNLADAKVTTISAENRFDAAYKSILQCAMAALWAKGFRTSTSEPGHHQTAIQAKFKAWFYSEGMRAPLPVALVG